MNKNEIVKRPSSSIKEKGQYAIAFSLIGVMLYIAGFPIFFLLFVGVLTYFIWKIFSSDTRSDVRRIFEFYVSANEILREDYRRWYGFEIHDIIDRGEKIERAIPGSPPLVHFALGALYDRLDDHSSAVRHLSYISEEAGSELGIVFPSPELREYVRILRKIERSPAEAPQTSAAVRSLERLRKIKTDSLLEKNRELLEKAQSEHSTEADHPASLTEVSRMERDSVSYVRVEDNRLRDRLPENSVPRSIVATSSANDAPSTERKTISEVLHDIYDENIQ